MDSVIKGLHPTNLRYLFYVVTPNETYYKTQEEVPNFTDQATVWMLILVVLEFFFLDERKYAFNDTITSINAGMLSLLFKFGGLSVSAYLYKPLFDKLHIIDLPGDSASTWIICFFTQDLMYYLAHRAIHEAGVFWSFHQMHHSSEYYNLSTALRQGAIQDIGTAVFDLLQVFFIPPNVFQVHRYLNILYQFWLHTEMVPYLGPLEYFLNTPSSHRVHHGRNGYCIDKNYGGTLCIWDRQEKKVPDLTALFRLFGTYAAEKPDEEIAYGLVTPVASFDQLWCQFFEFKALGWDKGQMKDKKGKELFPGTINKLKAAFWPPGYFPGIKIRRFFWWLHMEDPKEGIPEIQYPIQVYNPPLSFPLRFYLLVTQIIFVLIALSINEERNSLSYLDFIIGLVFIISMMQKFGYYFDHRAFAVAFDTVFMTIVAFFGMWSDQSLLTMFGAFSVATALLLSYAGCVGGTKKKVV